MDFYEGGYARFSSGIVRWNERCCGAACGSLVYETKHTSKNGDSRQIDVASLGTFAKSVVVVVRCRDEGNQWFLRRAKETLCDLCWIAPYVKETNEAVVWSPKLLSKCLHFYSMKMILCGSMHSFGRIPKQRGMLTASWSIIIQHFDT